MRTKTADTVSDHFTDDEFKTALGDAEANAESDYETNFVTETQERFEKWGNKMYFSESQKDFLNRLSEKEGLPERFGQ